MPAATGTRLPIVRRCGGASQPVASRKAASAAPARFVALDARADDLVASRRVGRLERQLVGERDRLHDRDERVQAVLARRADVEAEVDLAGREAAQPSSRQPRVQRAPLAPARALGARVGGQPERLERGAHARRGRRRLERDASARAPCGGARSPAGRARAARGSRRRRRVRCRRTQHGVDVGHGMEHAPRDRPRITFTSHASWASTRRDAVGGRAGRGGEALADLLLHHRHPGRRPRAAPRSCAGSRSRRPRRAGWRRPSSAPGRARRGRA